MAYTLQAFLAGPAAAAVLADGLAVRPVAVGQGVLLVPVHTPDADATVPPSSFTPPLWRLSGSAEQLAVRAAERGTVAYVEAELFGGVGEQHAVLWAGGQGRLVDPGDGAVNAALRALGVTRVASPRPGVLFDEFDSVDLGRHRSTAEWLHGPGQD